MSRVILAGQLDVAELCFYAFVLFFIGLVFYLRREDRREGYPLEDTVTGRVDSSWGPLSASMYKEFNLPFGRGVATMPTKGREPVDIAARRIDRFPGAPYEPTGNPLVDGIGPAAYAQRAAWPDQDRHGNPRIVPMASDDHVSIASGDPDPRGWTVVGADGKPGGTVTDLWVDRAEHVVRYYAVRTTGGREILAPIGFANIHRRKRVIEVESISAAQFEQVPVVETPGQVTRLEEDKIMGYFGGGYLYGLPGRTEPLL